MSAEPESRAPAMHSGLFFAANPPISPTAQHNDDFADDEGDDADDDDDVGKDQTHQTAAKRKLAKPKTPKRKSATSKSALVDAATGKKINAKDHSFDLPKFNPSKKRSAIDEVGDVIAPKKPKKKAKLTSGRAPVSRRIVPNYDSEDEIIVDMKQAGYPDEAVVKRLVEEGRTRYDPKSISSRWQRIRKAVQAAEDELLDEELTDWHEGEDDLLKAAEARAETKLNEELERIRQKKYKYVAQEINKHTARPRFSARACQERFEALELGTARIPPELDSDPEGRARERDERLARFKLRKEQELAQQAIDEAEERRAKSSKTKAKEISRQKQEAAAAIRAAKKKEEDDFKVAKVNALKDKRLKKEENLRDARDQRVYLQAKRKCESALLRRLQKDENARARHLAKYSAQFPLPQEALAGARYGRARDEAIDNYDYKSELAALESRDNGTAGPIAGGHAPTAASSLAALANAPSNPNVNVFGSEPRQMLTLPELYDIMRDRGMLLNRMKEVKGVVLQRLDNEDARMSVPDLRTELRKRGLPTNGTKKDMIRRVQENDAMNSTNYKRRYSVAKPPKGNKASKQATTGPASSRFTAKSTPSRRNGRYNARDVDTSSNQVLTGAVTKPTTSNSSGSSMRLAMKNSKADSTSLSIAKKNAEANPTSASYNGAEESDDEGTSPRKLANTVKNEKGDRKLAVKETEDEKDADYEEE